MSQIRTSNDGHLARHSAHFELLAKVARLTLVPEVARLNPWERETSKSKVLIGVLATVPSIKADEWNQKTEFTFSGRWRCRDQFRPPGPYVFKLADSPSNRNIVQVFNQDQTNQLR